MLPPFFEPAFEDDLLLVLLAAFFVFDAAFLPLLFALAFAFDPDFVALRLELDDFDFELDDVANETGDADREISTPDASVRALVIEAREDLEIAREVSRVLSSGDARRW